MKRKEYRSRLEVLLSVERDRWPDFVDLCDREHKSVSLKFSEMLEEELQKNVIGESNPLKIMYGIEENKLFQSDIRQFMRRNDILKTSKDLKADECELIANNLLRASRWKRTGIIDV